jgi:hypothetical protein
MANRTPDIGKGQRPKPQVIWFPTYTVDTPLTVTAATFQIDGQSIGGLWSVANDIALPTFAGQTIALPIGTVLAVAKADFQPDGQSLVLALACTVTAASFSIVGQTITLSETWSLAVDSAALQPAGQDITLNQSWSLAVGFAALQPDGQDVTLTWGMGGVDTPLAVDAAAFSIVGSDVGLTLTTATAEQPSGGWIESAYERRYAKLTDELKKELREEQEREELADRLEAALIAEGSLTAAQADFIRLQGLAAQYAQTDLTNRARRALQFAERAQTQLASRLAMRELDKLREEEEYALLLLMALD